MLFVHFSLTVLNIKQAPKGLAPLQLETPFGRTKLLGNSIGKGVGVLTGVKRGTPLYKQRSEGATPTVVHVSMSPLFSQSVFFCFALAIKKAHIAGGGGGAKDDACGCHRFVQKVAEVKTSSEYELGVNSDDLKKKG